MSGTSSLLSYDIWLAAVRFIPLRLNEISACELTDSGLECDTSNCFRVRFFWPPSVSPRFPAPKALLVRISFPSLIGVYFPSCFFFDRLVCCLYGNPCRCFDCNHSRFSSLAGLFRRGYRRFKMREAIS